MAMIPPLDGVKDVTLFMAAVSACPSGSVGSVTAGTAQVFAAARAAASDPVTISRRRYRSPPTSTTRTSMPTSEIRHSATMIAVTPSSS